MFGDTRTCRCSACGREVQWNPLNPNNRIPVSNCSCGEVIYLPTGEVLEPVGEYDDDGDIVDTYRLPDGTEVFDDFDCFVKVDKEES